MDKYVKEYISLYYIIYRLIALVPHFLVHFSLCIITMWPLVACMRADTTLRSASKALVDDGSRERRLFVVDETTTWSAILLHVHRSLSFYKVVVINPWSWRTLAFSSQCCVTLHVSRVLTIFI